MATLGNLIKNALSAKAKADTALWTAIGGRFYFVSASTGASKPYVLYSVGATSPRHVMGKKRPPATDTPIYFDVYSDSSSSTEAETIQGYIHDVFETVSITGYAEMGMRLGPEITIHEEDTEFWHINITYYAIATKN